MSRFGAAVESQTAQLAGTPSGTTFNGYFVGIVPGASNSLFLRRLKIGVRAGGSVPTSQQMTIALYRQTVRPTSTGFSTVVFQNFKARGAASVSTGVDITTAASANTTGPTIGANPLDKWTFNTQSGLDLPWEMLEELDSDQGTANGLALVNIGNALPAAHLFTVGIEIEE